MNKLLLRKILLSLCMVASSVPIRAATIDVVAVDSGFLTSAGGASKFDGTITSASFNYSVGWELMAPGGGMRFNIPPVYGEKKNYFVFDLSAVTAPIEKAVLKLALPGVGYDSADATETLVLSGTGATPAALGSLGMLTILTEWYAPTGIFPPLAGTPLSPPAPAGISPDNPFVVGSGIDTMTALGVDVKPGVIGMAAGLFTALTEAYDAAPGSALGFATVAPAPAGSIIEIAFTEAGLAYLEASGGGAVVIGGKLISLAAVPGATEEIFGFTDFPAIAPTLSITVVPVPAAVWQLSSAVFLLGLGPILTKRRQGRVAVRCTP